MVFFFDQFRYIDAHDELRKTVITRRVSYIQFHWTHSGRLLTENVTLGEFIASGQDSKAFDHELMRRTKKHRAFARGVMKDAATQYRCLVPSVLRPPHIVVHSVIEFPDYTYWLGTLTGECPERSFTGIFRDKAAWLLYYKQNVEPYLALPPPCGKDCAAGEHGESVTALAGAIEAVLGNPQAVPVASSVIPADLDLIVD